MEPIYPIVAAIPMIAGFGTSCLFRYTQDSSPGSEVLARPPAKSFGVIWAILYAMIGASWALSVKNSHDNADANIIPIHAAFSSIVASLSLWIIVYQKSHKYAAWVIVLSLATVLVGKDVAPTWETKSLLSPLLAWLMFAAILNVIEVQVEGSIRQPGVNSL